MAQNITNLDVISGSGSISCYGLADRFSDLFDKEVMIDVNDEVSPCVFRVPNTLSCVKPEAYMPQLIALGPYHRLRTELNVMERHKYAAIKRILEPDQKLKRPDQRHVFRQCLLPKLKSMEQTIRICYQEFLEFDEDTLAWVIAIDGLFLLHFLGAYDDKDNVGEALKQDDSLDYAGIQKDSIRMHYVGTTLIQDAVIRDVMMLENQIPVILLSEIWKSTQCSSSSCAHPGDDFHQKLLNSCEKQSPLTFTKDKNAQLDSRRPAHLLALMYDLIMKNQKNQPSVKKPLAQKGGIEHESHENQGQEQMEQGNKPLSSSRVDALIKLVKNVATFLGKIAPAPSKTKTTPASGQQNKQGAPLDFIKNLPYEKILKALDSSWDYISKTLGFKKDDGNPNVEEIKIPSVSQLIKVGGVKFKPLPEHGGIRDIDFYKAAATLYLPVISLNVNSEVILRNLVAYESTMPGSPVEMVQYVDLISGIIDTPQDARYLKDCGVIVSKLPDGQIANIFNGINKSNWKQGESSHLAEIVRKINAYYDSRGSVKAYKAIDKHIYGYWKCLTLVFTILLLLMTAAQSFCQVYDCSSFFGKFYTKHYA